LDYAGSESILGFHCYWVIWVKKIFELFFGCFGVTNVAAVILATTLFGTKLQIKPIKLRLGNTKRNFGVSNHQSAS